MLIDRSSFASHAPWLVLITLGTLAAFAWSGAIRVESGGWPGGSTLPGLLFGTAGALILLFEFLIWPRKKLRSWRIGAAQVWMRAHIWLGLWAVPLIVLHSGLQLGGRLSIVLMVLFIVVIISGIFGLLLQQVLPRVMLRRVPAETIYSQIDHVAEQLYFSAEDLVAATCGPDAAGATVFRPQRSPAETVTYLTVGAVRSAGSVQGKVLQTRVTPGVIPNSEPLRRFFVARVAPYLLEGVRSESPLSDSAKAIELFANLKRQIDSEAHGVVDMLEALCDQRRQFDLQSRIHFWLHSWLCVHLPLSTALVLLMFVHIYTAVKYW